MTWISGDLTSKTWNLAPLERLFVFHQSHTFLLMPVVLLKVFVFWIAGGATAAQKRTWYQNWWLYLWRRRAVPWYVIVTEGNLKLNQSGRQRERNCWVTPSRGLYSLLDESCLCLYSQCIECSQMCREEVDVQITFTLEKILAHVQRKCNFASGIQ